MEKKMKKPSIDWKIALDRIAIGEWIELKTLPGFKVQPRRFTKAGEAEISAIVARQQMRKTSVRRTLLDEIPKTPKSEAEQAVGEVSDETKGKILDAVIESLSAEEIAGLDTKVAEIAYGINAHNFNGDPEPGSIAWARELLPYKDTFDEILGIVEAQNLPLEQKPSDKSKTSPNGSTTATPSTT